MSSEQDLDNLAQGYRNDGVVCLRGLLDEAALAELEACFQWSLDHPTPSANGFYVESGSTFFQDLCNPQAARRYEHVLRTTPLAETVGSLWTDEEVWFLYEQVFVKRGGDVRRTPWHQDLPYLALEGSQLAVAWINFQPVAKERSLEFVRGSHRGTLYNGSAFDPDDDTRPIYPHGLPRLPDIEAHREDFDIVSFAVTPGDVVIFHPGILHGGAPTLATEQRRTLSLRFFGKDAVYAERPGPAPAPLVAGLHEALQAGDPFRHRAFPRLRPSASGFDQLPLDDGGHSVSLSARMGTP